jgi:hypothetical protein
VARGADRDGDAGRSAAEHDQIARLHDTKLSL